MKKYLFLLLVIIPFTANAGVSFFTDHKIIKPLNGNINHEYGYINGNYPYIGQAGLEYTKNNFNLYLSYIHRSNIDIETPNEYYYDGVALGIRYSHCILNCN